MYFNAQQYHEIFSFFLGHIRTLSNRSILRYPDGLIEIGGLPVVNLSLDYLPHESDWEAIGHESYDTEALQNTSLDQLSIQEARTVLNMYRSFIERFTFYLDVVYRGLQPYIVATSTPLESVVGKLDLANIKEAMNYDASKHGTLMFHPAPANQVYANASRSTSAVAKDLMSHVAMTISTEGQSAYLFAYSVYSILNQDKHLPLDPEIGLEYLGNQDPDEVDSPIGVYLPDAHSITDIIYSMLLTPQQMIDMVTTLLAAQGVIYLSSNGIVHGHQLMKNAFLPGAQNNVIDLESTMNDLLDNPQDWDQVRRTHLNKTIANSKILAEFDQFTKAGINTLAALETNLMNGYIKTLEQEADEVSPPQVIEHYNQFSW